MASNSFAAHERAWAEWIAQDTAPILAEQVPWPRLAGAEKGTQPLSLSELRTLQTRWHPDRFMQRFGARIPAEERDALLARVTDVAAAVNGLVRSRATSL